MEVHVLSKEEIRANAMAQLQRNKRIADSVILASSVGVVVGSAVGAYAIAKASTVTKVTAINGGYAFSIVSAPLWMKVITFIVWFMLFTWLFYKVVKFGAELFSVHQLNEMDKIYE